MTTTTPASAADRIAELRRQLEQIDVERTADPISLADDVNNWARRDQARRDRAIEVERQIRELGEYGLLLVVEANRVAMQTFATRSAAAKTKLSRVAEERSFGSTTAGGPAYINGVPPLLKTWWAAVRELANALPQGDPDALRVVCREIDAWRAARDGWLQALAVAEAGANMVPWPEDGGLPPGIRLGAHPAGDAP